MKSNLLLVLGAILILVIAVGCSNDSRTTAPADPDNSFGLSKDGTFNRFSVDQPVICPEPIDGGPVVTKIGKYHRTARGCQSIEVTPNTYPQSEEYYELTINTESPKIIENGSVIMVKGIYHPYPGGNCMLPSSIVVDDIYVLGMNTAETTTDESEF